MRGCAHETVLDTQRLWVHSRIVLEGDEMPKILVQRADQRYGPYSPEEVVINCRERRLLATDLAWTEGRATWQPLGVLMQELGTPLPPLATDASATLRWIVPVGRSGWAIAAGYLGLLSPLLLFAPPALACGLIALRSLKRHPELGGKGRAWFGIVMGTLFTLLVTLLLLAPARER